jgi:NADH:ubiquinone oxidoreductase subunit E
MTKKPVIYVCTNLRLSGGSCSGQGANAVLKALRAQDAVKDGRVEVRQSVCMGYCGEGPNVKIMGGAFHHEVQPEDAESLVDKALKTVTI